MIFVWPKQWSMENKQQWCFMWTTQKCVIMIINKLQVLLNGENTNMKRKD